MGKITIVVHGGAGPDSDNIKQNFEGYKKGLEEAVDAGYTVMHEGGSALDAVEAAVNYLEDNSLFNAGKGSALNAKAEVEMCASIMNGKDLKTGAVAIVKNVKNPVTLARAIMEKTSHIYLGAEGAINYAKQAGLKLEPDQYFITEHQYESYDEKRMEMGEDNQQTALQQIENRMHGTVGAVACDQDGNIAAATSTGGTEYSKQGRIGDSSVVGAGVYANNKTCAVSATGDGEYIIQNVLAHQLSSLVEYKGTPLQEACDFLLKEKLKDVQGDMGLISVDMQGNFGFQFNSERMHRAWKTSEGESGVKIYRE